MPDHELQLEAARGDIEVLSNMIDHALDKGASASDHYVRACAEVLYRRKRRLRELEAITLYVSSGSKAG